MVLKIVAGEGAIFKLVSYLFIANHFVEVLVAL